MCVGGNEEVKWLSVGLDLNHKFVLMLAMNTDSLKWRSISSTGSGVKCEFWL